jgi:hypothetical protein
VSAHPAVPLPEDWTDYGRILQNGKLGQWDYQLWGGFASTAVKKEGTYYLYYQGARGYRIEDDTVTFRAIGVATSTDGINFRKHDRNPVVTWFPTGGPEEGAASAAAVLDPQGRIALYYGANTEASRTTVHADARLALSADGLEFADQGAVLAHGDPSVWGSGDELFPIAAIRGDNRWFVYYLPNGSPEQRKLGVAWGRTSGALTSSEGARDPRGAIAAWGPGGAAKIDSETYALFLNHSGLQARTATLSRPDRLSTPVVTHELEAVGHATILLDQDVRTWFMYYLRASGDGYGVMLAPLGERDTSPPKAPPRPTPTPFDHERIDLTWEPATDAETGIVEYLVFRDGAKIAATKGQSFRDEGCDERTFYSYEISAVNYHGIKGPKSRAAVVSTPSDARPPSIGSVTASGSPERVYVVFNEALDRDSVQNVANYTISDGVRVDAASLMEDLRTVELTTSRHRDHHLYTLTVRGLRDHSSNRNRIADPQAMDYTFSAVGGLVACWGFEEGSGTTVHDTANFGHHGSLIYPDRSPATWTAGVVGNALQFDGVDDLVTIETRGVLRSLTDGGYTHSAWVRPQDAPGGTADHDSLYSILTRDRTGLYYDADQSFKAVLRRATGDELSIVEGPFPPGQWHHVAMVVDSARRELRLYVDGSEARSSPARYRGELDVPRAGDYLIATSDPLVERWDHRFKGTIDEVRAYNRALEPSEVRDLARHPAGLTVSGHVR